MITITKIQHTNKLYLDKYYTSKSLAKYCIDKTFEIIGKENISEIIEPSAGTGSFSNQIEDCIAYDIEPECDKIIKQDFLELEIEYKKGRLIIGNPPYGSRMSLAWKFYKKSIQISDYISFILPISQLNNNITLYEFDLIYSENLGKQEYSDRKLHCCLNIYKRPKGGKLNKRKRYKLEDITIIRKDKKKYKITDKYDIRMCHWGNTTAGKILKDGENYSNEYKIIINNKEKYNEIKNFILNYNWNRHVKSISAKGLLQYHIIEVLKDNVEGVK